MAIDDEIPWTDPVRVVLHLEIDKELVGWLEDEFQIPEIDIPCDLPSKLEWILRRAREQASARPAGPNLH